MRRLSGSNPMGCGSMRSSSPSRPIHTALSSRDMPPAGREGNGIALKAATIDVGLKATAEKCDNSKPCEKWYLPCTCTTPSLFTSTKAAVPHERCTTPSIRAFSAKRHTARDADSATSSARLVCPCERCIGADSKAWMAVELFTWAPMTKPMPPDSLSRKVIINLPFDMPTTLGPNAGFNDRTCWRPNSTAMSLTRPTIKEPRFPAVTSRITTAIWSCPKTARCSSSTRPGCCRLTTGKPCGTGPRTGTAEPSVFGVHGTGRQVKPSPS
mmetsp:Transcript_30217/g.87070  ORF Transcript_30217/g.87070 Transcript_30217/m.87070 type:complete len:269 (-) Transcript_30217:602-1408(-)